MDSGVIEQLEGWRRDGESLEERVGVRSSVGGIDGCVVECMSV